ncbi:ran guanine nucleotide release factor-like protein, putative [Babesia ovata]|uniref:Ran guanine nucleotide release factor-like protein, putative n=1 Tax=Babesia ovata TaxID=189622 RepID=A0A2H6KI83_9APIC|nr:ran guanine nucleotide release factor-like protein, putative [Babesia ovata]GBE62700.1 ran guanine nucleotide release factor-like protein, putative [Babesia ovata]
MINHTKHLYGGSIACRIPPSFQDLSDLLPVPDHQEVFIHYRSGVEKHTNPVALETSDYLLSFEILEYEETEDDETRARYLFHELACWNEAAHSTIITHETSKAPGSVGVEKCKAVLLVGTMDVTKDRRVPQEVMRRLSVFLYVLRLREYQCDILVSYNFPLDDTDIECDTQLEMFKDITHSIQIIDDKLFIHRPL